MAETQMQTRKPSEPTRPEETRGGRYFVPRVDICESHQELTVMADMPGVKSEDVDVQYEQGELRIHGRVQPRQPQGHRCLLREYEVGDFYRAFRVGEAVNASDISAEMKDGLLTLHLPKKAELQPRRITVKAS